jgi:hypothetical protein
MSKYKIKLSDSNGLCANVGYVREESSHRVRYYAHGELVGEEYFNTEGEATSSAINFINGEQYGSNFNFF